MMRIKNLSFLILLPFLLLMYPKELKISIIPQKSEVRVKAGSEVIFSLKVVAPKGKIAKISGHVREYTDYIYEFNDEGKLYDKKANDGIWSSGIEVPGNPPPGKYYLDCEPFDIDGNSITTKSKTGEEIKFTATFVIIVEWKLI